MTRRLGNAWQRSGRATRCRGARGSSLVEVSTTLVLLGLVMGVLYSGIASFSNTYTQSARRTTNLNEARVLMADATKDFRTAVKPPNANSVFVTFYGIPLAGPTLAWFYGYVDVASADVAASWVLMSVDNTGQLIEYVWAADPPNAATPGIDWTYTQNTWHTRFVGRYIANPASIPVFTYLDAAGNVLAPDTTGFYAGWLNPNNAAQVAAVKINLVVRKTQARASDNATGDATLINRVRLPNIDQLKVPPT